MFFRHSTPHIRKSTFETPLAKACQAPVAERPVVLPPELSGSSHAAITHLRSVISGRRATELSQMRYGNVVIAHYARSTLARQAHVRVPGVRPFGRGHYRVRRRLRPSQAARRAWNPAAKSTSLPRAKNVGGGLGRKANQKFRGDDRRFCGGCRLADLRHGHGDWNAKPRAHDPAICAARRAARRARWRAP